VGRWGADSQGHRFILIITGQQGNNLQGTLQVTPPGGAPVTGMLVNSTIQGNNVTVHVQIGSAFHSFKLTLSADGRQLNGSWSDPNTGTLYPIAFGRLLT
jgi:hypothetical protein